MSACVCVLIYPVYGGHLICYLFKFSSLSIIVDENHLINLWLKMGSMSMQMSNETNLSVEESKWGQGIVTAECNVAVPFLYFLHCSVAMLLLVSQAFTPCLTTSCHLSLFCTRYSRLLGVISKDFMEIFSVSLKHFSNLHGSACPETVCCRAVSSEEGNLSCWQHDQPNKTVIASRWYRCWKEKTELKLCCQGCVFGMWCRESSSDRSCGSSLAFSVFFLVLISSPCFTAIKEGG